MKTIALTCVAAAALFSLSWKSGSTSAAPRLTPAPVVNTYTVDTGHSRVVFKIKHANASWFYGTLGGMSGTLTIDPQKPEASKIDLKIAVAGIDTDDDKRDEHLRGPDFFDAKQHPEITFVSTKARKDGDGLQIDGELTLLGVTKPVAVTAQKVGEAEFHGKRVGYETVLTIKRSTFGMKYGVAEKALGDEVTLMIAIEAVQAGK